MPTAEQLDRAFEAWKKAEKDHHEVKEWLARKAKFEFDAWIVKRRGDFVGGPVQPVVDAAPAAIPPLSRTIAEIISRDVDTLTAMALELLQHREQEAKAEFYRLSMLGEPAADADKVKQLTITPKENMHEKMRLPVNMQEVSDAIDLEFPPPEAVRAYIDRMEKKLGMKAERRSVNLWVFVIDGFDAVVIDVDAEGNISCRDYRRKK
jgi:hypothetical protein